MLPDGSFQAKGVIEKLAADKMAEKKKHEKERKRWLREYASIPHSKFIHLMVADACQSYSSQLYALHRQLQALTDWLPSQKEPPSPHNAVELETWKETFTVGNDDDVLSNEDIDLLEEDGDDIDDDD